MGEREDVSSVKNASQKILRGDELLRDDGLERVRANTFKLPNTHPNYYLLGSRLADYAHLAF